MKFRPSSVVAQQIEEFEAIIPKGVSPPAGDFAAQLQWDSWQTHLHELKEELERSIDHEMVTSDLQISLSGKPVTGHSVCAGFLAGILSNAEKLVAALSDVGEKIKDSILGQDEEAFGLMIDGAFESSFGLKMRLSSPESGEGRSETAAQVADQFCGLFNGAAEPAKLDALLSRPEVRSSYLALMKCLAKSEGKIFVRTRAIRYGMRMNSYQAKQRIEWLSDSSKRENLIEVQGILTGGSISSGRFEITSESSFYRGPISAKAKKQMVGIRLGQEVVARIKETKVSGAKTASNEEASAKHYLESISTADESDEQK